MSKLQKVKDYYARDARSQSELKALSRGLGTYKKESEEYFREEPHFIYGDALDCLVTMREHWDDKFFISDALDVKPTNKLFSVVVLLWDTYNDPFNPDKAPANLSDVPDEMILEALDHENYNPNWKADTRIKKVREECSIYWQAKHASQDRQILSVDQYNTVKSMHEILLTHDFTRDLMAKIEQSDLVMLQEPLYFKYLSHECKALPDIVLPEGDNTMHIIDLKTTSDSVKAFPSSVRRFRYDVQMAWYALAVETLYPEAHVKCSFLVKSLHPEEHPLIYRMTNADLNVGKWGAYRESGELCTWKSLMLGGAWKEQTVREQYKTDILGYEQMLYLWEWHYRMNQWEYDKDIAENNGEIEQNFWNL